ncbi:MAG TPA: glycine/sarcosine/betaine reductase component B subunit [candidate division Zixibacteria bacterium]|nr:glycine/sarcosine/betaine reductase component B subunit [candidate division Zixibacteria bacterium]
MLLELADFPVKRIRLGDRFHYCGETLEVAERELLELTRQDERLEDVSLAVVHPGEKVRVTGIRDLVEPRVKASGGGEVFPGTLGPVAAVGRGRTHRLSGMAVVAAAEYEGIVRAGLGVQRSAILDFWGPGAEASRFSRLSGLVVIMKLREGLSELQAHAAIQGAAFKVARRLAGTTLGLKPPRVETLTLDERRPGLPKVALIQGCLTDSHNPHSGVSYYGLPIRDSLATFVHPNELFDGAVTIAATRAVGHFPVTWDWQNHALARELYRHHGRSLNFLGVVLERIQFDTFHAKEVAAHNASRLAAALGADGALIAWIGSGNAFVDLMLTLRACERLGIRTVLVTYEFGGRDGVDSPLLYYVPEADAIVSTGSRDRWLELPSPDRVVGPYERFSILSYPGAPVVAALGELTLDARDMVVGGVDNWGTESWTCRAY